jgi:hypothetical protein
MILRTISQLLTALLLLVIPAIATAQTPSSPTGATSDQLLKPEQLEALVSPIALYPDSLLSSVLMASTYPLEIVQAERWLTQNKNLSGDVQKAAVDKQAWDDSVKALIATPPVLAMMNSELDWTQKLGDAVLAQQADVMDAIQRLRLRAQDNGKLTTTPEQKVTVEQQDNRRTVLIDQASDDTVYVPAYDPAVAYGTWPYADYPPSYWGYPDYWGYPGIGAGVLARGLWFGTGYALGRWGSGNWAWGGRVNWGNGNIIRNWPRATPYNVTNINNIGNNIGNNWQHNPAHRLGVRYNNASVQQRFGNANRVAGGQRGNLGGNLGGGNLGSHLGAAAIGAGAGAALRGGQRPNAGNRQAQRPNAGNRQAQRPNAGNRQAQRPNAGNRQAQRPSAGNRQAQRPSAGNRQAQQRAANRPAQRRTAANRPAQRFAGGGGRSRAQSFGGGGFRGGGGGMRAGGGGGFRGGGGGRGGGRRSDIRLKHDVVLLGHLDNGIGFYRFDYNGSDKAYVGVIAQEVQTVMPQAVTRDRDGYLRVFYDKLGVTFQTYDHWIASGARVPIGATRP